MGLIFWQVPWINQQRYGIHCVLVCIRFMFKWLFCWPFFSFSFPHHFFLFRSCGTSGHWLLSRPMWRSALSTLVQCRLFLIMYVVHHLYLFLFNNLVGVCITPYIWHNNSNYYNHLPYLVYLNQSFICLIVICPANRELWLRFHALVCWIIVKVLKSVSNFQIICFPLFLVPTIVGLRYHTCLVCWQYFTYFLGAILVPSLVIYFFPCAWI